MYVTPQLAAFLGRKAPAAPPGVLALLRLRCLILRSGLHARDTTALHAASAVGTIQSLGTRIDRKQATECRHAQPTDQPPSLHFKSFLGSMEDIVDLLARGSASHHQVIQPALRCRTPKGQTGCQGHAQ